MRWLAVAGLSLGALLLPAVVLAGESVPEVRWQTVASCPGQDQLEHEMERLLKQPLDTPRPYPIVLQGELSVVSGGSFEVVVRSLVQGRPSERRLLHHDCTQLTNAAALVMAMAIDADAVRRPDSSDPGGPPEPAAPVAEGSASVTVPMPEPVVTPRPESPRVQISHVALTVVPRRRWSFGLAALGGATWGPLPNLAPFLGLAVSVWRDSEFGVALMGRAWWAQKAEYSGRRASIELVPLAAGMRGCWIPRARGPGLGLCLGPELVSARYEPVGDAYVTSQVQHASYWQVVAAPLLQHRPLPWLRLAAFLETGWIPEPPAVGVEEGGTWHQVVQPKHWMAGFGLSVGIEIQ